MILIPRFSPTVFSVASNTFAQMLGKVATAGTTFLMTIAIARAFGAQGYGDFTKITTYVALFFLFADFGLNAIYLQHEKEQDWNVLLAVRLVGSIILLFLAVAVLSFLPQSTTDGFTGLVRLGIILYSPAIIFQALLTTANAYFQKHLRYSFSTIAVAVGSVVSLVLVWISAGIFTQTAGTVGSVVALLVGSIVTAALALFFVGRLKQSLSPSFNRPVARALLFSAIPLGATLIFNVVYFRIDSLIMTLTRTTAEVGIYGLAYKFFELPLVLPTFFMNSVFALMVRNADQMRMFKKSFLILLPSSLLCTIVLWSAAPFLSLIKQDFSASVPVLRVLSLSFPFFFLTSLAMWTIIALKKQTALLFIYGVSMIATIGADLLFIPTYGMMAAAWITVGSEGMILIVSLIFLLRYIHEIV
ncbi:oligosaccharide flippase family protein [Candidatus Gottesmanbacteria bacterium]|nr:oligosaccharide flippase family protein [Candidatus Gottesmanbacteria bacterium]